MMPPVYGSRTIVLAPKWLGDTIMALPVLEAISENRPQGVDILAPEPMERLLKATRLFRLIIPNAGSVFGNRRLLTVAGYDEAFILPNSFRSAWIPFLSSIPVRRGYRTDYRNWLINNSLPPPRRDRHQVFDYDGLLSQTGIERSSEVPKLILAPGFLRSGDDSLRAAGVDSSMPFVGLNPGGIGNPLKRWPTERFAELAGLLRRDGIPVIVFCGPPDLDDARKIASATSPALPVVAADQDQLGLASMLAHCTLLVTNDSGGMHLAAAAGVTCLALFGPTDPLRTGPRGEGHRVIRGATMDAIETASVVGEARRMFAQAVGQRPGRTAAE